jgi:hypothetical protein
VPARALSARCLTLPVGGPAVGLLLGAAQPQARPTLPYDDGSREGVVGTDAGGDLCRSGMSSPSGRHPARRRTPSAEASSKKHAARGHLVQNTSPRFCGESRANASESRVTGRYSRVRGNVGKRQDDDGDRRTATLAARRLTPHGLQRVAWIDPQRRPRSRGVRLRFSLTVQAIEPVEVQSPASAPVALVAVVGLASR